MSYTEIYILKNNNDFGYVELKNSHRGAMYVWHYIATHYCGMKHFPHMDRDQQMEIWNYDSRHPDEMETYEKIVLKSTMDNAIVEADKWKELVHAFKKYGKEHPNSNYSDQASEIEKIMSDIDIDEVLGIAWNQTSVGDAWCILCDEDEDTEEYVYTVYDPNEHDDHFWVFEELGLD